MKEFYDLIAPFYDAFNREVPHAAIADLAEKCFQAFPGKVESVLDLGTGTGSMALELARRGYDMVAVDRSPEMLSVARRRAEEAGVSDRILFLCQEMTAFELYGTVEAVVCTLDGVNHLLTNEDLASCFRLVHNYLVPDGLFFFDINSPYKFEYVFRDHSFVLDEGYATCMWQNFYHSSSRVCEFLISLFTEEEDGRYKREDTVERERMYTPRILERELRAAGMELLAVFGDTDGSEPEEKAERLFLLARAIKN